MEAKAILALWLAVHDDGTVRQSESLRASFCQHRETRILARMPDDIVIAAVRKHRRLAEILRAAESAMPKPPAPPRPSRSRKTKSRLPAIAEISQDLARKQKWAPREDRRKRWL